VSLPEILEAAKQAEPSLRRLVRRLVAEM